MDENTDACPYIGVFDSASAIPTETFVFGSGRLVLEGLPGARKRACCVDELRAIHLTVAGRTFIFNGQCELPDNQPPVPSLRFYVWTIGAGDEPLENIICDFNERQTWQVAVGHDGIVTDVGPHDGSGSPCHVLTYMLEPRGYQ